jgi:hypothetical protein
MTVGHFVGTALGYVRRRRSRGTAAGDRLRDTRS